jgi:predicted MFS family arabinose efflux permease
VTAAAVPARPGFIQVLGLSTALHVVAAAQVFTVPAVAPAIAASMGISESLVGAQVILVYVSAMIASIFAGSVVVRLGPVQAAQLCMAGSTAGLALATVPSVPVIALASVILGLSYGLVNPATGQMLDSATDPSRRSLAFSIKQAAVPVGGVLAGAIAPWITIAVGWQGALLAMAGGAVAGALLLAWKQHWFPYERPPSGGRRASLFRDVEVILKAPVLRYTCLGVAAFAGVQLVLTTYLVTILVQHVGLGLVAAGVALSFFNGGGMAGRFAWGWVADAARSGLLVLAGVFGLSVLLLLVFPFIGPHWPTAVVYGFVGLLGVAVAGWAGVFVSEVLRLAPPGESARALAGAFVFTFGGGPGGLGVFLLGFQLLGNYGWTIWVIAGMASMGFLLSLKALAMARVERGR